MQGTQAAIIPAQANAPAVQPQSEAVTFLHMIERASRDETVDIEKMERLMAMHERMIAKQAEADFNDAMAACQREISTIAADATNPQTRSRYATYAKLDGKLRPIYTKHGISLSYGTEPSGGPDHVRVIAYVARGGYTRKYQIDMPNDGKGAKGGDVMTKTHAQGAGVAYGMRYLLKAIFNVAVGEEDRDGNAPDGLSEEDKDALLAAVDMVDSPESWESLWKQMTAATTKARDVATHEEFRAVMARKRKEISNG